MRLLLFVAPALIVIAAAVEFAWIAGRSAEPTAAQLAYQALAKR